jgi:dTDP-4-dehydrorhamnose reductase
VVNDQLGSPTYAKDLAGANVEMVNGQQSTVNSQPFGIYHFSNDGVISW